MPLAPLARLVQAVSLVHGRRRGSTSGPEPDHRRPAVDQTEAGRLVRTVVTMHSSLDRALVLAAVRHELRLPVGAASVPAGALHLERADDSSVVVASVDRHGSRFSGTCAVRDTAAGSTASWRITAVHRRGGLICGFEQLHRLPRIIERAVIGVDAGAVIERRIDDLGA